ncbi:hypothetical protein BDEG_22366 [Batrachochytrium dendrobatidis JEL423]|uniref:Peptidase M48 domain-containing protein n=1 Tax=Batrachochytrium dendrobatidis (strain JEL423) TaxID=403673 RepID=A0A177WFH1_BATDL|nr:hypothetical protein BDEG_22366 [Batrachochytrium dendrobatidis JEL423]
MVSNQIQLDPLAHLMALLPQLLTRTFSSIGRQATTIQSIVKISNKLVIQSVGQSVGQPVSQSVGQLASPISQRSLVSSVQFRSQYQSKPSRRITKNTTLVSPITASDGYQRFKNGHPRIYPSKRFYLLIGGCIVLFSVYYYEHLETVPISGRRRFNDVSPGMERLIGNQTYEAVMHEYRHAILPAYHPQSVFVRRIAGRLIKASGLASPDWEVFVINDPQTNAFVLPNGKIFVFSGIIPIAMNEDGIATILGHEIAHHVARHSAEKLAWGKLLLIPQILITLFLGPDYGSLFRGMIMELAILRPFSRKCESEADYIGLQIMSKACYNPSSAIQLWQRMSASQVGANMPQFLSTHPSDESRIDQIQKWLPEAMQTYVDSGCNEMQMINRGFIGALRKWTNI